MNDLVRFNIPAEFINERIPYLTPAELKYGYKHGWVSEEGVVQLALAGLDKLPARSIPYEALALLISDQHDQIPDLVDQLDDDLAEAWTTWLYLALSWVYSHRNEYEDPLQVVEMIYADFDYPTEIENLVRFMPAPPGQSASNSSIERSWQRYLEDKKDEYRRRTNI